MNASHIHPAQASRELQSQKAVNTNLESQAKDYSDLSWDESSQTVHVIPWASRSVEIPAPTFVIRAACRPATSSATSSPALQVKESKAARDRSYDRHLVFRSITVSRQRAVA